MNTLSDIDKELKALEDKKSKLIKKRITLQKSGLPSATFVSFKKYMQSLTWQITSPKQLKRHKIS